MPYYVYILQSRSTLRHYCGSTSNVDRRVRQHNDPEYKGTLTTKRFKGPWDVMYIEECNSRSMAMAREKQIKSRGIKRFLVSIADG